MYAIVIEQGRYGERRSVMVEDHELAEEFLKNQYDSLMDYLRLQEDFDIISHYCDSYRASIEYRKITGLTGHRNISINIVDLVDANEFDLDPSDIIY